MSDGIEENVTGCGEQVYGAFGANYEDGICINGYLWDLDSCDEPGGPLRIGGDDPCPLCNAIALYDDDEIEEAMLAAEREPRT